jgi:hypothetical protein
VILILLGLVHLEAQARDTRQKNEVSSETQYECHAGAVMAGVALIGEVVSLPE